MAGADVNTITLDGKTVLSKFAASGKLGMIKFLIRLGVEINSEDTDGKTALIYAAEYGSTEVLSLLLENKANILHKDKNGYTCLHYCVIFGHLDGLFVIYNFLLKEKILAKELFYSVLVSAIIWNQTKILDFLIKELINSIELNQIDEISRQTALTAALQCHMDDRLCCLIDQYFIEEVNTPNVDGYFPIEIALTNAQVPDETIFRLVKATKANILSSINSNGKTCLMTAIEYNRSVEVIRLLNLEGVTNLIGKEGKSPLHFAMEFSSPPVISALLQTGAKTGVKDDFGRIPLHYAVLNEYMDEETISIICKSTIDISIVDVDGFTPLDLAFKDKNILLVCTLLKYGSKITNTTWDLCFGNFSYLAILLEKLMKDCRYCIYISQFHLGLERIKRLYGRIEKLLGKVSLKNEINYLMDMKYVCLIYSVICLSNLSNYGPAINLATKAITLFPKKFEGYFYRARLLRLSGQIDQSVKDLEIAKSIDPSREEFSNFSDEN